MLDEIKARAAELLSSGKIKGFLGLKAQGPHISPHLFIDASELEGFSLGDVDRPGDGRYPLPKILIRIAGQNPAEKFGLLVRGCDERAVHKLFDLSMLQPDKVVLVGLACPEDLAQAHQCAKPYPDNLVAGEPVRPCPEPDQPQGPLDLTAALKTWLDTFDRCLKCFGCRNVCPVCVCPQCSLEEAELIDQKNLPPDRNFLLTRAIHMVDRCVYCGLCEEACPMDIPLKQLYKLVAKVVGREAALGPVAPLETVRAGAANQA